MGPSYSTYLRQFSSSVADVTLNHMFSQAPLQWHIQLVCSCFGLSKRVMSPTSASNPSLFFNHPLISTTYLYEESPKQLFLCQAHPGLPLYFCRFHNRSVDSSIQFLHYQVLPGFVCALMTVTRVFASFQSSSRSQPASRQILLIPSTPQFTISCGKGLLFNIIDHSRNQFL